MIRTASLAEFIGYYRRHSQEILSDGYVTQLGNAVSLLEQYHGPTRLEDLTDDLVNGYCDWLAQRGRSADTVRGRRNSILTLWRAAFQDRIIDDPPKRIRKIRTHRRLPQAWTHEEVRLLLLAAQRIPGRYITGIARATWWASLIAVAWDTGLRLGDLLRLEVATVSLDRPWVVRQHKTSDDVLVSVAPGTADLVRACVAELPARRLIWPLWGNVNAVYRQVRRLVLSADIRPGTFRWIRRAAITSVEAAGGNGSLLAGHRSRAVTIAHYIDASQLAGLQPRPEPL